MRLRNIFVAAVLVPLMAGSTAAQEKTLPHVWKLKYQGGSAPFEIEQPVTVLVDKEFVRLSAGKDREQEIRTADITQITYDTMRGRYASRALANTFPESQTSGDLVLSAMVCLPLAVVALPFKGTRHFVTIEWAEGNRHRAVVLRLKGKTAKEFIAELEHATELTARDLDRERKEFKDAQKKVKPAPTRQDEPAKAATPRGK